MGGCWVRFLLFNKDYIDDFMLVRVEQEPSDQIEIIVSASLASDPAKRRNLIISPQISTNWDTTVHALGYTVNTHTMRITTTPEKVAALKELLNRK